MSSAAACTYDTLKHHVPTCTADMHRTLNKYGPCRRRRPCTDAPGELLHERRAVCQQRLGREHHPGEDHEQRVPVEQPVCVIAEERAAGVQGHAA